MDQTYITTQTYYNIFFYIYISAVKTSSHLVVGWFRVGKDEIVSLLVVFRSFSRISYSSPHHINMSAETELVEAHGGQATLLRSLGGKRVSKSLQVNSSISPLLADGRTDIPKTFAVVDGKEMARL